MWKNQICIPYFLFLILGGGCGALMERPRGRRGGLGRSFSFEFCLFVFKGSAYISFFLTGKGSVSMSSYIASEDEFSGRL